METIQINAALVIGVTSLCLSLFWLILFSCYKYEHKDKDIESCKVDTKKWILSRKPAFVFAFIGIVACIVGYTQ